MSPATKKRAVNIVALVALAVTLVGVTTAAVVWAADEHKEIRDRTIRESHEIERELKEAMKEQYVPKAEYNKDVTTLGIRQEQIKKDVGEMKVMVRALHDALPRAKRVNISPENGSGDDGN